MTAAQRGALRGAVGADGLVPLEWIVDVADEGGAFHIGTAYAYDDRRGCLRVAIPDRADPAWEGDVRLDARAVRLLECVDAPSRALFARAAARSAVQVEWRVEWLYVADADDPAAVADAVEDPQARWAPGEASWLVRLENKLLVHFDRAAGGAAAAASSSRAPGVWA